MTKPMTMGQLAELFSKLFAKKGKFLLPKKDVIILWGTERIFGVNGQTDSVAKELYKISSNGTFQVLISDNLINRTSRLIQFNEQVIVDYPEKLLEKKEVKVKVEEKVEEVEDLL